MKTIVASGGELIRIDDEDYSRASALNWYVGYTDRNGPAPIYVSCTNQPLVLARLILGAPPEKQVDHIDGDVLNAQKQNLRLCSHAENMRNRRIHKNNKSGFKGVYPLRGKFVAQIKSEKQKHHLGTFETPEKAHEAYREAASRLHGEFARFN